MDISEINLTYDIESFPNFFCAVFANSKLDDFICYEISERKNDYNDLMSMYSGHKGYFLGFNCLGYDSQLMEFLLKNKGVFSKESGAKLATIINDKSKSVVEASDSGGFGEYPEWRLTVKHLDLFKMNHYDNVNKSTSLKWVEFSIDFPNVQDLPFHFSKPVPLDNFDDIIEYCKNDVSATLEFANRKDNRDLIKLRLAQNKEYPYLGLLNKPDSSVGESIFLHKMSEAMSIDRKELKERKTNRTYLDVVYLLLPYINFKTDVFNQVLDYYKKAVYGLKKPNGDMETIGTSMQHDGIEYTFGEGGIHASRSSEIFESDDEYEIWDWDVESYYPKLAIVNKYKPEHLGDYFSVVYNSIFKERKNYPKGTVQNLSYKIILNGCYGKLNSEHSFLYDVKPALQICINGQLLLLMLCERFTFIEDCQVIQANTDGVTIKIKKKNRDDMMSVVNSWQKLTSLTLEGSEYDKMVITDVNNYAARYVDGSMKYKGSYEIDKPYHKNKSQRIVPIALKRYFFDSIPIKDTVLNHLTTQGGYDKEDDVFGIKSSGIYDFCIGKKIKSNQRYIIIENDGTEKVNKEKVIRYYVTKESSSMVKQYSSGRVEAVNKGFRTKLFQRYEKKEPKDYNIDYMYYMMECYKITSPFDNGNVLDGSQLSLFQE